MQVLIQSLSYYQVPMNNNNGYKKDSSFAQILFVSNVKQFIIINIIFNLKVTVLRFWKQFIINLRHSSKLRAIQLDIIHTKWCN